MTAVAEATIPTGAWLKITAAREQCRAAQARLTEAKGDRTAAKESLGEAQDTLDEALDRLEGRDPNPDETVHIGELHQTVKRRREHHHAVDRDTRSKGDTVNKLRTRVDDLLDAAMDPMLFETFGDGIAAIELRDLLGGPTNNDNDEIEYPARPFERVGVRTLVDYCNARRVTIPQAIDDGELTDEQVERADLAAYTCLSLRDELDRWQVDPPRGAQLSLDSIAGEDHEDTDDD